MENDRLHQHDDGTVHSHEDAHAGHTHDHSHLHAHFDGTVHAHEHSHDGSDPDHKHEHGGAERRDAAT
jgi:hypothetical protein